MKIIYFTKTGNVARFIKKLAQNNFEQIQGNQQLIINEPVILITYTTGIGEIPPEVKTFCDNNRQWLTFVIASGNRNWGKLFALSGDLIASEYGVKLLYKFEISGTSKDVDNIRNLLEDIKRSNYEQISN
ncbi:class Ib ribonucleoside-diphosphate reductase assembly flavoprotein NrdI [Mollicutes bacterium LVI A0039]|nr:class Ib ribonucleoside-diphosphate reductase assembly flavoprotein NrdI [Mollicutes bacterium LVI A0039]